MSPTPVDVFVKTKVPPEYRPIAARVRKIMREVSPQAVETFSYGMPVWKINRMIAWIMPSRTGITFGLSRGTQFADKYRRLRGVGKSARHLKLKTLQDASKSVLAYYIRQAVKLDRK